MRTRLTILALWFAWIAVVAEAAPAGDIERWDARFARAKESAARQLEALSEWCAEHEMPFTANVVRYRILRFLPDHPPTREHFGYERRDGAWWRPAARREEFRVAPDADEGGDREGFAGRHEAIQRRIAARLRPLARAAGRHADSNPDPAREIQWLRRTWAAWKCVLVVAPEDEAAHQGLHHPIYEGRYVPSTALPFLEARTQRRERAAEVAERLYELGPSRGSRLMVDAGVRGFQRRTPNLRVATTFGDEAAVEMATWGERAIDELVRVNRFPATAVANHRIRAVYVASERSDVRDLLRASGWDDDRIERQLSRFRNAYVDGGVVAWRTTARGGKDAVMHYAARSVIRAAARAARDALADEGPNASSIEPWLLESLISDVVRRLTGEVLTRFSRVPEYAHGGRDTTGADHWMSLARYRVEVDDDVPFSDLVAHKLNDLDGAATVKGYGLLQYLHERDTRQAARFVWVALAKGSVRAAEAVWGQTLEELDEAYRKWVLVSW